VDDEMTAVAIGVDLGGTNLRSAVVTADGEVLEELKIRTQADQGVDAVIERLAGAIQDVSERAGLDSTVQVGVAAPGPLDPRAGVVHFAPNLPGWTNVPLRDRLMTLTGRSISLGNDANAAALGELYFGAGKGIDNLIYVGLGTGVGGGVISEGRLIDGLRGMGGELGHTTVSLDGPRCSCGSLGCIEAYCSAWALTREAESLVRAGRGQAIAAAAEADGRPVGPRAIGAAAAVGDRAAIDLLHRAGTALGAGLANFVNIFNPELIVLGGGVSETGEPLLDPVRAALQTYAIPVMHRAVRLVPAALGLETGIYGAAALVFHENHP
jgi:glucokinase